MIKALIPFLKNVKSQLLTMAAFFAILAIVFIIIEASYGDIKRLLHIAYILLGLSGLCIIGFIFKNGSESKHKELFNELKEIKEILIKQERKNDKK